MSDTDLRQKEDQDVLDDLEKDFSPEEKSAFEKLDNNDSEEGGLYRKEKESRVSKKQAFWGSMTGLLVGGSIFGFGLLQGFFLPIHLTSQLERPHLGTTEDFGSDRGSRALRYFVFGSNATRSRLSPMGNFVADRWETKQQNKSGVKSVYDPRTGQFRGLEIIDYEKFTNSGLRYELEKQGFEVKNSQEELSDGRRGSNPETRFRELIDVRGESNKRLRILDRRTRKATSTLRITSSTGGRALKLRRGVSWHPMDRLEKRILDRLEKKRLRDAKDKELETGQKSDPDFKSSQQDGELDPNNPDLPDDSRMLRAVQRIRSIARSTAVPIAVLSMKCAIEDFSSAVEGRIDENEAKLLRLGGFGVALGNQTAAGGSDTQAAVLGAYVEQYHDDRGRSVFQDPRLQAENGKEPTADDPFDEMGDPLNPRGLPGPVTAIANAPNVPGACRVIDAAGGAVEAALRFARMDGLIDSATNYVADSLTGKDVEELQEEIMTYFAGQDIHLNSLAGPSLGATMNVGTRLLANDQFRFMGAVAMSNAEANTMKTSYNSQINSEFADASLYDRYFNLYEDRSLASGLLQESPQDITTTTTMLANIPSTFSKSIASVLNDQKAYAQSTSDMYSFPLYGFTEELRNDDRFQNPYANEEEMEKEFERRVNIEEACHRSDTHCPQQYSSLEELNTGKELTDRGHNKNYKANGKSCFGVEIEQTGGLRYGESPLMNDIPDECAEETDIQFLRYRFYVADTTTFHSAACFEGRAESCTEIGFSDSAPASAPATGGDFRGEDTSGQTCQYGTDAGEGVTPDPNIKIRLCNVSGITVNVAIEENVHKIIEGGNAAGLNYGGGGYRSHNKQIELRREHCGTSEYDIYKRPASECDPPTAPPGRSLHEWGLAVDFSCDGATLRSGDACFNWLVQNQQQHNLINLASEPWHWSSTGS